MIRKILLIIMAILIPAMVKYTHIAKEARERTENPPYEYFSF